MLTQETLHPALQIYADLVRQNPDVVLDFAQDVLAYEQEQAERHQVNQGLGACDCEDCLGVEGKYPSHYYVLARRVVAERDAQQECDARWDERYELQGLEWRRG